MQWQPQGQRSRARDLLTRLLRTDQSNPQYWLWMSAVVDSNPEKVFCLQNVLRLEPDSQAAKLGLLMHGALHASTSVTPVAPVRRKWAVSEAAGPPMTGFQKVMQSGAACRSVLHRTGSCRDLQVSLECGEAYYFLAS
jgi:hypothetical protein